MSKLIVEMEMPKDLAVIVTILPDGRIIKHLGYKDKKQIGRIVGVLPEQHGDLIDRDALLLECTEWFDHSKSVDEEDILNAKAVIASERSERGTAAD